MDELEPRQEMILRAIIFEYVSSAEPVGSEAIAARYPLGVKSATVRSEMAEMLDRGILEQPHTSAGRIPSDAGYRYYVDRLIEPQEASAPEVQAAVEPADVLGEMVRGSLVALSRLTRQLAVAATHGDGGVTVRTAVVSALGPAQALLVLALSNGHVETRMVRCPPNLTLADLGRANEALGSGVVGKPLRGLTRVGLGGGGISPEDGLLSTLAEEIREASRGLSRGRVMIEGEAFIFSQPEFAGDAAALGRLIDELTSGDELYRTLQPVSGGSGETVTIGRENGSQRLQRFSIVRRAFFAGSAEAGTIAVVGPTRMSYESSIPIVNATAEILSRSLARYFEG